MIDIPTVLTVLRAGVDPDTKQPHIGQDEALTAIYEIGLEVIGKDVVEEDDSGGKYKLNKYLVAENRLRRQQRKAWAKACGVAEK